MTEAMIQLHGLKSFRSGRAAQSDPGQKVKRPKGARNSDTKYRVLIATWQGLTGVFLWALFRSWSLGLWSTDYHLRINFRLWFNLKTPATVFDLPVKKKRAPLHFFSCSNPEDGALPMTLICICLRSYTRFLILKPFKPCLMLSSLSHTSSQSPVIFC